TAPGKPRIRRSPTSQSAPPPVRTRPDRQAGPIACASTTSCFASKKRSARAPCMPGVRRCASRRRLRLHKLVLLRHGESTWNKENRFTGWTDVDLSDRGREEAAAAGRLLREGGYVFDVAYVSVLKRAILTMVEALNAVDRLWIPVQKNWRLNERHYGALQGLNKAEKSA